MNSNHIFSPETPAPESKIQSRSRLKVAVFSVIAVHVAGLMTLLMTQGCRREAPQQETEKQPEPPLMDTNIMAYADTNYSVETTSNTMEELPMQPPIQPTLQSSAQPYVEPQAPAVSEYVVQKGDSFFTIAKTHGTTSQAIQAANPTVDSRRLQIGQKLVLPPPSATTATGVAPTATSSANVYVVVSGDTLSKIARRNNTTVKELKSLNNLATDQIKVGQKLKLPAQAPVVAPAPLPGPAPMVPAPGQ